MAQNKVFEKIIRGKKQRRKELSALSFEEKIHILVELQRMAEGVKKKSKTADRIVWHI